MPEQYPPIRVGNIHRIKRTWLRRVVIVLTCPLLFLMNFVISLWAYAKHICLVTLAFLLFRIFGNNGPLIKSIWHYWNSSERLTD